MLAQRGLQKRGAPGPRGGASNPLPPNCVTREPLANARSGTLIDFSGGFILPWEQIRFPLEWGKRPLSPSDLQAGSWDEVDS